MKKEWKIVLAFMGSLWLAMPLYIMLHEGGHALIASLCGAKIIAFNMMQGYVITEGGAFNEITLALFYAAGMLTPAIIFAIYVMLYQRGADKNFYKIFSAVFAGVNLFSMGVWVVIPVQYMLGRASPNDDVTKFIETLKIAPLMVAALTILIMSIYIWVVWKKRIFQNGYRTLKSGKYGEDYMPDCGKSMSK